MTTNLRARFIFRFALLVCLAAFAAEAQYQYYFSDSFNNGINLTNYWSNGSGLSTSTYAPNQWALFDNNPNGGALISKAALPTGNDYEVKATLHLDANST